MKYFATFRTNSSYINEPFEYTCKATAIKDIRGIAEGQVNGLQDCNWSVTNDKGETVAEGGRINGVRFRNI